MSARPHLETGASAEDVAYCAGIVDGEGCLELVNGSSPRLTVAMCTVEVLHFLAQVFGGNIRTSKRPEKVTHRPAYRWALYGDHALWALRAMVPHLIEKRAQAEVLFTLERGVQGRRLTEEQRAERKDITRRLAALKRGAK